MVKILGGFVMINLHPVHSASENAVFRPVIVANWDRAVSAYNGRMEPIVDQSLPRQSVQRRHLTAAAEGCGGLGPHVVYQDDQHVGRAFRLAAEV